MTHIRRSFLAAALVSILFAGLSLSAQTNGQLATLALPDAPGFQSAAQPGAQKPAPQASPAPPPAPSADTKPAMDEQERKRLEYEEAERELKAEEHQRIGGIVPNFNAVLDGSALPLSRGQKMRAAFRSAIDPYQFLLAGIASAYGQATDSHSSIDSTGFRHGYPQGFVGYTKRFGSSFADQFDGTILGNGVFPALFKQDARYFRKGTGPIGSRAWYSVLTTVRCKGDNGKWQPNVSNLLGNLASGGISNIYYPAADRGVGLTIEQGMLVTAEGAFGALLIEFYPDVQKHLFHKKDKNTSTLSTSTPPPTQ